MKVIESITFIYCYFLYVI